MKTRQTAISSIRGLGLIEIMIALALGAIIILGITEIATRNSITRNELEGTGRQIETAAYAMRVIESDVYNAAFWGERGEVAPAATPPPICADTTDELEDTMGYPLQGGQGDVPCAGGNLEPKASTDFLAIRRASSCALGSGGCDAANSNFHLQVHACFDPDSALKPGDSFELDTNLGNLTLLQRDCIATAPQYRFLNHIYFVNDNDTLVRAELEGTTYVQRELVENVESLRFEYGLDNDADGQVDAYASNVSDPNDPSWPNVIMVRMGMIVRNHGPSAGYVDNRTYTVGGVGGYTAPSGFENYRRQLYSRTVTTRNIAGRRETP